MALQRLADCLAALGVPQPHRSILPGAHNPAAIGAELRRQHRSLVALQRLADRLAALGVPQPHRSINPGAHDPAAIGAERRRQHLSLVALQWLADRLAALGVPQPHRSITPSAHNPAAICAELRRNPTLVALQWLSDRLAAAGIPQPHRSILSSAHNPAAISAECRRPHPSLIGQKPIAFAIAPPAFDQRLGTGGGQKGGSGLKPAIAAEAGGSQGLEQGIGGAAGHRELGAGRERLPLLPLRLHQLPPGEQQGHGHHRQAAAQAAEQKPAPAPGTAPAIVISRPARFDELSLGVS